MLVVVNIAVLTKSCFDVASTSFYLMYYSYKLILAATVLT